MTFEEFEQLSKEEQNELFTVDIITPNGENVKLSYAASIENGDCIYSYSIFKNGNYTFKVTNSKGSSSEITVPVGLDESKIKKFTLEVSETETKTFSFIEGQTWGDFIGENTIINIDGVKFRNYDDYIAINITSTIGYVKNGIKVASLVSNYRIAGRLPIPILYTKDGENKTKVLPTDEIVAGGEYCYVLE